jgi:hypothetical protein
MIQHGAYSPENRLRISVDWPICCELDIHYLRDDLSTIYAMICQMKLFHSTMLYCQTICANVFPLPQPQGADGFGGCLVNSSMKHHKLHDERSPRRQPFSPASYTSSMRVHIYPFLPSTLPFFLAWIMFFCSCDF